MRTIKAPKMRTAKPGSSTYDAKCLFCNDSKPIVGRYRNVKVINDDELGTYPVHEKCYKKEVKDAKEALKRMGKPITQANILNHIKYLGD